MAGYAIKTCDGDMILTAAFDGIGRSRRGWIFRFISPCLFQSYLFHLARTGSSRQSTYATAELSRTSE